MGKYIPYREHLFTQQSKYNNKQTMDKQTNHGRLLEMKKRTLENFRKLYTTPFYIHLNKEGLVKYER